MKVTDPNHSTRTRLLDAAEGLMLSRGYVAATVDGICDSAGLTKGSFFHYFKSKEELGKVLIQRFAERQKSSLVDACASIEDPLERVYGLIEGAIQGSRDPGMKGCLVGTLAQEISETHPELRDACNRCFESFAAGMGRDLEAAKQLYCPDAHFDANSLGAYFLSVAQGSMLIRRASGDHDPMEGNLMHFRAYLKVLYGR